MLCVNKCTLPPRDEQSLQGFQHAGSLGAVMASLYTPNHVFGLCPVINAPTCSDLLPVPYTTQALARAVLGESSFTRSLPAAGAAAQNQGAQTSPCYAKKQQTSEETRVFLASQGVIRGGMESGTRPRLLLHFFCSFSQLHPLTSPSLPSKGTLKRRTPQQAAMSHIKRTQPGAQVTQAPVRSQARRCVRKRQARRRQA